MAPGHVCRLRTIAAVLLVGLAACRQTATVKEAQDRTPAASAPIPPANAVATAVSATGVRLTWTDRSDNETALVGERSASPTSGFSQVREAPANTTTVDDAPLQPNTTYHFRVLASNDSGHSGYSNVASVTTLVPAASPPEAPSSAQASALSSSSVWVTWVDNSSDEAAFQIERSGSPSGSFVPVGSVGAGSTSYRDTGLAPSTTPSYRVRASNVAGSSDYSNVASATTLPPPLSPPAAPAGLVATAESSSAIRLDWAAGPGDETGFRVERSLTPSPPFALVASLSAGTATFEDAVLQSNTTYSYRVLATNSAGPSTPSEVASATTLAPATAPPPAPSTARATALSSSGILVTWSDDSSDETAFQIERSTTPSSGFVAIALVSMNVTSYGDLGLAPSTAYYYRVRASNAAGDSTSSIIVSATTAAIPVSPPAAPTGLVATASSSSAVHLSWVDRSADETAFRLERSSTASPPFTTVTTVPADTVSADDAPLQASTTYFYRVLATSPGGESAPSNVASVTTSAPALTPPAAPSNARATAQSHTSVTVTWTDNSSDEATFQVERSAPPSSVFTLVAAVGANVTSLTDTGLAPSTAYAYRVRASNSAGSSSYSATASATTPAPPASPPAAPSGLIATVQSSTAIRLAWADNSGDETSFRIERSTSAGGGFVAIGAVGRDVSSYGDSGLAPSTAYFYRVRASNAAGDSSYSATASATTPAPPASPPAPPSGLVAAAQSSTSIHLGWVDNSNDENRFAIERSLSPTTGFNQVHTTPANTTGFDDAPLLPSTTYSFRVRAGNDSGSSSYSNVATATTLAPAPTVPAAPTNALATAQSSTSISVTWTDNSSDETGFQIERGASASGPFVLVGSQGVNVVAFADAGLTPSTAYFYRVRAANAAGSSGYSNVASATTAAPPASPPAAPSGLVATAQSSSAIHLGWSDNSADETGFRIERSASAGSGFALVTTVAANTVAHDDQGLPPSSTVYYRVFATSSSGDSAPSSVASATTLAAQPTDLPSALAVLAQHAIFFDHASVGLNVMAGVERLLAGAAGAHPTRFAMEQSSGVSASQVAQVGNGVWADHYFVAENGYPFEKMAELGTDLGGHGLGAKLNTLGGVVFMKLCFADFDSPGLTTTGAVDSAFTTYQSTMASLALAYPGVKLVYVTSALRSGGNDMRERFNQHLRDTYGSTGRVFDLANLESNGHTDAGGARVVDPAYNAGDDHLDTAGQDAVARALVLFLAGLF